MSGRVDFPVGLARFSSLEEFHLDDERRRQSGERDYGSYWWDGEQGLSDAWRVSAVNATGDVYAMRLTVDAGAVVVLGTLGPLGLDYELSDSRLEGWNLEVGKSSSLQWVIDRVLEATGEYPAPISILCRWQLLGAHVHADLFVGRQAGSRGKAGELILQEDEWAVFLAGLEAGFGDRLELVERA